MLNIAYTHGSVVSVLTKQAISKPLIIQYDVGGCVICISNKVEYLDNERSYKILPKKLNC